MQSAIALVKAHSQSPYSPSIGDLPPFTKAPPKGITVDGVSCGIPLCDTIVDGVQAAAKAIGWKFRYVNQGATPTSVATAWNSIVQNPPNAVASVGIPVILFQKQQAALAAKGVPHVGQGVMTPLVGGLSGVVSGVPSYLQRGSWMAQWVMADSKGTANSLYVNIAEYPSLVYSLKGYKQEIADCPGCKTTYITAAPTAIGTTLPQQIVSAIERDPSIKYVVGSFGDVTEGVPEALASAGIHGIRIISANTSSRNLEDIKDGTESASVGEGAELTGWLMVDELARILTHQTINQANYQNVPHQFITQQNIGQIKDVQQPYQGVPGYQQDFEKLWNAAK